MNKILTFIISVSVFSMLTSSASGQLGSQHFGDITTVKELTPDGSTWVYVTSTDSTVGERMSITVDFRTSKGVIIENVNYDIKATQDGTVILDEKGSNHDVGSPSHLTSILGSGNSVDITIMLRDSNSIEIIKTLKDTSIELPYNFPSGEKIQTKTVPEFGSITMVILFVSILSIVGLTSKAKKKLY